MGMNELLQRGQKMNSKILLIFIAPILVLCLCPNIALALNDEKPNLVVGTVATEADNISSGVWGTCEWTISGNGALVLSAGIGELFPDYSPPWSDYMDDITSVTVNGTVILPENVRGLFDGASNMVIADLSGFDTSNVANMRGLFCNCTSLKSIDLSSWDTSNTIDMSQMFAANSNLATIYVGDKWTTERVIDSDFMFAECESLSGGYGTTFDRNCTDVTYAHVDALDTPGYLTYKTPFAPKSSWVKEDGKWRYYDSEGNVVKNAWQTDSAGICRLDADGYAVASAWRQVGGKWYHFDSACHMEASKWVRDSKTWCYVDADGAAVASAWRQVGGKWYHFDSACHMVTGVQVIGGKVYRFNDNGTLISPDYMLDALSTKQLGSFTKLGIDVSQWNGDIDWNKVRNSGVDFAIIRCGYGDDYTSQDDITFLKNVSNAKAAGVKIGVYLYSYAHSTDQASSEAAHTIRLLKAAGLKPSDVPYGVYYDLEETDMGTVANRGLLARMSTIYCTAVQSAGYRPGVYSSLWWWNTYLTDPVFDKWSRWVAQWNTSCTYLGAYDMWQCSSEGSIPGIDGRVDTNVYYR